MVSTINPEYVRVLAYFLLGFIGHRYYVTWKKLKKWESKYDFTNHTYIGKRIILQGEEWVVEDFNMKDNKGVLKNLRKGDYLYADRTASKPVL